MGPDVERKRIESTKPSEARYVQGSADAGQLLSIAQYLEVAVVTEAARIDEAQRGLLPE